jgi:UPF0271 protein
MSGTLAAVLRVDLNADVGESFGAFTIGSDGQLLGAVTSASVAAGFHAGDPSVLRATIRRARDQGVSVGAHPGLPDLVGFGRRELKITPSEAEDLVLYQVAAVQGVAQAEGIALRHVKPHGALYTMASRDPDLASAIARAVAAIDRSLVLFAPAGSALLEAGIAERLGVAAEGFADRAYERDGSLARRSKPHAVLTDPHVIVARAVRMVTEGVVTTIDGADLPLKVETLCVHGDTPGAADLARALRQGLEAAGISVRPVGT